MVGAGSFSRPSPDDPKSHIRTEAQSLEMREVLQSPPDVV